MRNWILDAALAALALLAEVRRRRSRLAALPTTATKVSYNQPNVAPACLKRHFLQTTHGQLLYRYSEVASHKAPLLILLHHQSRSSDQFCELIQLACTRFRCVAPDLLGHGESDKPSTTLVISDYADHVLHLMDALNAEKAFVVGDSFGAFVAAHLACHFPNRIHRAVLANIDFTPQALQRLQDTTIRKPSPEHRYVQQAWQANVVSKSRELNHRCAMDRLRLWGFDSYGETAMVQYWQEFIETAQDITCPVMLVWGRENLGEADATRLTWRKDGTKVERAMPHAEVVYLQGEICMMERFADRVFARIAPFLRERLMTN